MGVSLAALGSACCGLRFASVLRYAPHWANAHPPHASRMPYFDILPNFVYISLLVLFNIDYHIITRLKFFILFSYLLFILFCVDFQICTKLNFECMDF
ncbi:MAG: hypothetical protein NZ455_03530 [Bacteroidia bacterium]|nr:hypothetical protein [Bacteroidia bacterium]MDW8346060.1 hypothetical protein [Bacteroidia bacterium]